MRCFCIHLVYFFSFLSSLPWESISSHGEVFACLETAGSWWQEESHDIFLPFFTPTLSLGSETARVGIVQKPTLRIILLISKLPLWDLHVCGVLSHLDVISVSQQKMDLYHAFIEISRLKEMKTWKLFFFYSFRTSTLMAVLLCLVAWTIPWRFGTWRQTLSSKQWRIPTHITVPKITGNLDLPFLYFVSFIRLCSHCFEEFLSNKLTTGDILKIYYFIEIIAELLSLGAVNTSITCQGVVAGTQHIHIRVCVWLISL